MSTPQIRDRATLRTPTRQCEGIGCTRPATQTATLHQDPAKGLVPLCDVDAAYMADVVRYRQPGWGAHRYASLADEHPVTAAEARDTVERAVREQLDREDPVPEDLVARSIDALAAL